MYSLLFLLFPLIVLLMLRIQWQFGGSGFQKLHGLHFGLRLAGCVCVIIPVVIAGEFYQRYAGIHAYPLSDARMARAFPVFVVPALLAWMVCYWKRQFIQQFLTLTIGTMVALMTCVGFLVVTKGAWRYHQGLAEYLQQRGQLPALRVYANQVIDFYYADIEKVASGERPPIFVNPWNQAEWTRHACPVHEKVNIDIRGLNHQILCRYDFGAIELDVYPVGAAHIPASAAEADRADLKLAEGVFLRHREWILPKLILRRLPVLLLFADYPDS